MVIVVIIDGKVTEIFCMADGFCKFFEIRTNIVLNKLLA